MSVPVADQDAALEFYTGVLGCERRTDMEVWPGARMIEVVPPGSSVSLVLLTPDSQFTWRSGWAPLTAQQAHDKIREAGAALHNDELVRREGVPPMFSFTDPDGNGLVCLEGADQGEQR